MLFDDGRLRLTMSRFDAARTHGVEIRWLGDDATGTPFVVERYPER